MVFSSEIFLFIFLPLTIIIYFLSGRFKNIALLVSSLLFYAWGEPVYILLMLGSVCANYLFGLAIEHILQCSAASSRHADFKRFVLAAACALNLLLLGVFKYTGFVISNLNHLGIAVSDPGIDLPIGISFYTFQSISYIIDVYQGKVPAQKSILKLGLYISMFPQLIAGPIVRYSDVEREIDHRQTSLEDFYEGTRRFMIGFSKKILIADIVGKIADTAFSMNDLSMNMAWLGAFAYALQIYFDFSGYSDMAIGLGRIFGFHFLENFNYPYISKSIQEFWRRWHMSLGGWFRDYVYIPLGGSRCPQIRVSFNLFVVFFLTGLWHGASWNFVVWGIWYAIFLIFERFAKQRYRAVKFPSAIQHIYAILVIVTGWVFFRAETCRAAFTYIGAMFSFRFDDTPITCISLECFVMLMTGMILSIPVYQIVFGNKYMRLFQDVFVTGCFIVGILYMVGNGFSPFLYFRF